MPGQLIHGVIGSNQGDYISYFVLCGEGETRVILFHGQIEMQYNIVTCPRRHQAPPVKILGPGESTSRTGFLWQLIAQEGPWRDCLRRRYQNENYIFSGARSSYP